MTKEKYLLELENIKLDKKDLVDRQAALELSYIEALRPCNIGDTVEITLGSGRKVKGEALSFGILAGSTVNITSYKEGGKSKYVTTPHQSVEILQTA